MWSLILLACTAEKPESPAVVTSEPSAPLQNSAEIVPKPTEEAKLSDNITVESDSLTIKLPSLSTDGTVQKYCFIQEMPSLDIGMVGLSFTSSRGVQFIRLRGVYKEVFSNVDGWSDCQVLGNGYPSSPIYEMVGIDLAESEESLFNGFQWVSLPDQTAFVFPGTEQWLFEVHVDNSKPMKKIEVSTIVDTVPKSKVESWAGVIDLTMEKKSGSKHESDCVFSSDIEILSAFGHSEPTTGSWSVSCGEEEVFAVDSAQFASNMPPLKNFEKPRSVTAGTECSLQCDWGEESGEICLASLVATDLKGPVVCLDGLIIP